MASNAYVLNVTRGCYVRYKRALKAINETCSAAWVEEGVSIRNLTIDENIKARNEQARVRVLSEEILGAGEVHGLRYVPPTGSAYEIPWQTYEGMEAPMGMRYCRWPRRAEAHDFAPRAA